MCATGQVVYVGRRLIDDHLGVAEPRWTSTLDTDIGWVMCISPRGVRPVLGDHARAGADSRPLNADA